VLRTMDLLAIVGHIFDKDILVFTLSHATRFET
jgi:hypothetical protein